MCVCVCRFRYILCLEGEIGEMGDKLVFVFAEIFFFFFWNLFGIEMWKWGKPKRAKFNRLYTEMTFFDLLYILRKTLVTFDLAFVYLRDSPRLLPVDIV